MNILNSKYIEQLAKGEIAICNINNPNLELLRKILKETFTNDASLIIGAYNYYHKDENKKWKCSDTTSLPTIKLEDFLIKELPTENFVIENKEDSGQEILNCLYSLGFVNRFDHSNTWKYYYADITKKIILVGMTLNSTYKLFTLEEIKQLENNMEENTQKKLIGYKLLEKIEGFKTEVGSITIDSSYFALYKDHPKFEAVYEDDVKIGDWVTKLPGNNSGWMGQPDYAGAGYNDLPETFVVESLSDTNKTHREIQGQFVINGKIYSNFVRKATKEEIEKHRTQLPEINRYKPVYSKTDNTITYGCATFQADFFKTLNNLSNFSNSRTIKSIELSSGVKITKEQIEQIVKFIDNQ